MMKEDLRDAKFFAEVATYEEAEKEEAKQYLSSWKKFLLRRLKRDSFDLEVVDEMWGEQPPWVVGALCQHSRMYLKLCIRAKWGYEI